MSKIPPKWNEKKVELLFLKSSPTEAAEKLADRVLTMYEWYNFAFCPRNPPHVRVMSGKAEMLYTTIALHCLPTGQLLLHNINIVVSCSLSLNFLRNISNPQTKTCEFVIKLRVQSWTVGKLAKLVGEEIVIATILLSPINKVLPCQDTSPQYQ